MAFSDLDQIGSFWWGWGIGLDGLLIFVSSVAALYAFARSCFYRRGPFHRGGGPKVPPLLLHFRPQFETIVHRASEILLAAKIPLGCLHRRMPQQELNLLQFTTTVVTQLRACSPQVVRCDVLQTHPLTTGPNDVPDYILRDAPPPNLPRPGDCTKYASLPDTGGSCPLIERRLDPIWYGYGADVPAFADQIHYRPVTLANLDLT
jgi:hypothetical protein